MVGSNCRNGYRFVLHARYLLTCLFLGERLQNCTAYHLLAFDKNRIKHEKSSTGKTDVLLRSCDDRHCKWYATAHLGRSTTGDHAESAGLERSCCRGQVSRDRLPVLSHVGKPALRLCRGVGGRCRLAGQASIRSGCSAPDPLRCATAHDRLCCFPAAAPV